MTYTKALQWIFATQKFGIKPGLATMRQLAAELQLDLGGSSATRRRTIFHVAGTNGKGSVCAMLDSMCRALGLKTGLYTSPHLISFRERMRVSGVLISEQAAADGIERLRGLLSNWPTPEPTFFEWVTALALLWFQESDCDAIVLETGLGGRWDATNVVTPSVSVLTPVAMDHCEYLGSTIGAIAGEKAGIIKPSVPAVSAAQMPEAEKVFEDIARAVGCAGLTFVRDTVAADLPLALAGQHQRQNASLALAAMRASGLHADPGMLLSALAHVQWDGRFQEITPGVILDGAHNPHAAIALVEAWHQRFAAKRATLVFACMGDKDLAALCGILAPIVHRVILPRLRSPRAASTEVVRDAWAQTSPGLTIQYATDTPSALRMAAESPGPVLVCGSLHLVGEALAHFRGETPDVSLQ